jgi:hypothetical protein
MVKNVNDPSSASRAPSLLERSDRIRNREPNIGLQGTWAASSAMAKKDAPPRTRAPGRHNVSYATAAASDSNRRSEGTGTMTKSSRTKRKQTGASPSKAAPAGATSKSEMASAPTAGERTNRDNWVQMSFRAPAAVEEYVMTMCVRRKITLQTLILELLRGLGAPISDADLQDNRKGRKGSRPNNTERQALESASVAGSHDGIAALEQLRDSRLWEQIAQQANGQAASQLPGTLQVIFANFVGEKAR